MTLAPFSMEGDAGSPFVMPRSEAVVREGRTFRQYITACAPQYRWYWHCEQKVEVLQAVADGSLTRVMIFEPPRHSKTLTGSRLFPAYFLARYPERWVGLASYEATLAEDMSRSAREYFRYQGGPLDPTSSAVSLWHTMAGGGMWASGAGGPLTGKGFHLGIIDDPIKNDEAARSAVQRAKVQSWYEATWTTRREPGACEIVTNTRWHTDDLAGYLLAKEVLEPEGWHVVCFDAPKQATRIQVPGTCTVQPDPRSEGEALCPERYDVAQLARIRGRLGTYHFSALYLQRPVTEEGETFKRTWWRYQDATREVPVFQVVVQSWDMAFKDDDTSDYVVGQVWGVSGPDAYLLDQVRERLDFPATLRAVKQMTRKWPAAVVKYVEAAANGHAVIQTLRQVMPGVIAVKAEGGKVSRAATASAIAESGHVVLPRPDQAAWVAGFVEECASFPVGMHDDQVDAMSQALAKLGPALHGAERAAEAARQALPAEVYDTDRHPGYDRYGKRKRRGGTVWDGEFRSPEPVVPGLDEASYGPTWEAM